MIFGAPKWPAEAGRDSSEDAVATARKILRIEASAFYEEGIGFARAIPRTPDGETSIQGWVVGRGGHGATPDYPPAASALHALCPVWECMRGGQFGARLIRVAAGGSRFCRHMNEWVAPGKLQERSSARSEIAALYRNISESLTCALPFIPAGRASEYRE